MEEERGSAAVKSERGSIPLLLSGEAEEVDITRTEERGQDESTALAGSGGEWQFISSNFMPNCTQVCVFLRRESTAFRCLTSWIVEFQEEVGTAAVTDS